MTVKEFLQNREIEEQLEEWEITEPEFLKKDIYNATIAEFIGLADVLDMLPSELIQEL